jgi:SNF2 family DNA or RNA helicase
LIEPNRLFPYQAAGVQALLEQGSLLLADDMGLGKTIQAITALRALRNQGELECALIVVPAGLMVQWRSQLQLWAPELRCSTIRGTARDRTWQWRAQAEVFLVSYETLRSDFSLSKQSPVGRDWDVLILDEAQRIKNRERSTARVCKQIRRKRAWALTGTPLENSLDELASVVEVIAPLAQGERPKTYRPGIELLARHQEIQLRRRKVDVLQDLPPKLVIPITVELTMEQRKSYDQAEQDGIVELKTKGSLLRIQHVLELILRLKQICNFCPRTSESTKLDDLRSRLDELSSEGHRALVFSQYTDDVFGVAHLVKRLGDFSPLAYTGSQTFDTRDSNIQRFKDSDCHKVLILSLRAGGQGLNLQEASYVFHFDRWWNPAVEHQAEDRAHRLGQVNPVFIYTYTCADTIEERIAAILRAKQDLFDDVVDLTSFDVTTKLSLAELLSLFGLKPEEVQATSPSF